MTIQTTTKRMNGAGRLKMLPRRQRSKELKTSIASKPDRLIRCDKPGEPSISKQTTQGHHEGLETPTGNHQSVKQADHHREQYDEPNRHGPRNVIGAEEVSQNDTQQGKHRADREIDSAGDDHGAHRDAEDAKQSNGSGQVQKVGLAQKNRVCEGGGQPSLVCFQQSVADEERREDEDHSKLFFLASRSNLRGSWMS